jgi:DNA-binding phage protein
VVHGVPAPCAAALLLPGVRGGSLIPGVTARYHSVPVALTRVKHAGNTGVMEHQSGSLSAGMTPAIRERARIELTRQDVTQTAIAARVGVSRQYLSRMLRGHVDGRVDTWRRILDELGLELVVRPKGE